MRLLKTMFPIAILAIVFGGCVKVPFRCRDCRAQQTSKCLDLSPGIREITYIMSVETQSQVRTLVIQTGLIEVISRLQSDHLNNKKYGVLANRANETIFTQGEETNVSYMSYQRALQQDLFCSFLLYISDHANVVDNLVGLFLCILSHLTN